MIYKLTEILQVVVLYVPYYQIFEYFFLENVLRNILNYLI